MKDRFSFFFVVFLLPGLCCGNSSSFPLRVVKQYFFLFVFSIFIFLFYFSSRFSLCPPITLLPTLYTALIRATSLNERSILSFILKESGRKLSNEWVAFIPLMIFCLHLSCILLLFFLHQPWSLSFSFFVCVSVVVAVLPWRELKKYKAKHWRKKVESKQQPFSSLMLLA